MKSGTARAPVARYSSALHRATATPIKPAAPPVNPAGVAEKRPGTGEERRRSQRVLLRVRAHVHVAIQGKNSSFDVTTLSVNPHGALILLERNLPAETRLVLEHGITRDRVTCKVSRAPREMPEGYHVPLEFDSPAPEFWRIAFPPADWRPTEDS
ncbi:MAG TPA: hypothetical protein VEG64_08405 [Candidatus Sulfotelmatobacter sp.]|nr:hypothetical protein [Candidatus Sulfotelmatobacter sp.]